MSVRKVIRVNLLDKRIDQPQRGWLLQLMPLLTDLLGEVADIHTVSFEPGIVRGNHFHKLHIEALLPISDGLRIVWIDNDGRHEEFAFGGETLFVFPAGISHAIRNDSAVTAYAIAFGNRPFDPDSPDRYPQSML